MRKPIGLFVVATMLTGCASLSELPQSSRNMSFGSLNSGKMASRTYEDNAVFSNVDKEKVFAAAKEGLVRNGFIVKKALYDDGVLLGSHARTAHYWNIVAGVYIEQGDGKIYVKAIVKMGNYYSLAGTAGASTSADWPRLIMSAMQDYIFLESHVSDKPNDNPGVAQ